MDAGRIEGYDVIGDVHGQCDALERLLTELGYRDDGRSWRHPARQAVFVGDLIDRGPRQIDTVMLVRRMVGEGTARMVLGNHEYNAIAWTLPDPDNSGQFVRKHNSNKRKQHLAFLEQVGEGSARHADLIGWFATLPMWTEVALDDRPLRIVHACWDAESMAVLGPLAGADGAIGTEAVVATRRTQGERYDALEVVLKGPEVYLNGSEYLDHGGHRRGAARLRWWDPEATTLDRAALIPKDAVGKDGRPLPPLPAEPVTIRHRYRDDVPLIVGHYWCSAPYELYGPHVACVDYSAGKGGGHPLVAYRWSGERLLDPAHYVGVPTPT
jgi:hypothetical protein